MNPSMLRALRILALVSGTLVLAFVLIIAGADVVGALQEGRDLGFTNTAEQYQFLMFPIGLLVGLALAYKWELLGGAVAVLTMTALCVMRPDLLRSGFYVWASPGLLYVVHALLKRRAIA